MSSPHLDLDALADLLADRQPVTDVHLDSCPACRAALADLEAALTPVRIALATLPDPALPETLPLRLESALAAERAGTVTSTVMPTATVTPIAARRDRRTRWLPAASGVAAAAALVVGAIVLFTGGQRDRDATTALSEGAGIPSSSTGTDYRKDGTALQQALPDLLAGRASSKAGGAAPQLPTDSATDTRVETFAGDQLADLRDPTKLASCLAALSDADEPGIPLALDYASFEGKPALVVVLPTTKAGKVDVFVVGAGCSQADEKLLFFTRLSAPG